ncbi:RING-H2 finger protein ATL66-like isoform X1 [Canna indica]|uniref:RING-H2 finger protein ATL66-like isoform X1 n=1 Tax=Canna indica TaxID=4628 RepID=A0AAQ3QNU9_9LILI|nr:RING-H2 finger protein ATL66-like isoform X1 [Canna indica]
MRAMPQCGHAFHRECIDTWLLTRSSFCPVCRSRVVEREVEPAIAACAQANGDHRNVLHIAVQTNTVANLI